MKTLSKQFANLLFALFICTFLGVIAPFYFVCVAIRQMWVYDFKVWPCILRFEFMCILHSIRDNFRDLFAAGLFNLSAK